MAHILIIYTTLRGHTGKIVEPVAKGIRLLSHGLIPHYGPVVLGEPSAAVLDSCRTWGKLVKRLRDG